jgi:hypothetical protein
MVGFEILLLICPFLRIPLLFFIFLSTQNGTGLMKNVVGDEVSQIILRKRSIMCIQMDNVLSLPSVPVIQKLNSWFMRTEIEYRHIQISGGITDQAAVP